jgi:histidinol-phosphate aminotransferase
MHPETAAVLHQVRPPFNVNIPAQVAATAALDDTAFLERTRQLVWEGIVYLGGALDRLGMRHFPTQANFFLIDVGMPADDIYELLLRQGVITRSMSAYGFPRFIRVNIGLPEENERLVRALEKIRTKG